MKRELRHLLIEASKKMRQAPHRSAAEFERVSSALAKRHVNLRGASLRKLWGIVAGHRKLSPEALDRLALLAGFQDWHDLREALYGDADASINYEEERDRH